MGSFALHYLVLTTVDWEGAEVKGAFATEPAAMHHARQLATSSDAQFIHGVVVETWEGPTNTDRKLIWYRGEWKDGS